MTHPIPQDEQYIPRREAAPISGWGIVFLVAAIIALTLMVIVGTTARAMPIPAGEMSRSAVTPMPSLGDMSAASAQTSSNLASLPGQILARLSQDPGATFGSLAQLGLLPPAQPTPVGQGNAFVPFGERDSVRFICERRDAAAFQLAAIAPRDGQYRVTITPAGSPAATQVLLDSQLRASEQILLVTPVPQGAEVIVGLTMPVSADAQFSGNASYTAPRCG